MDVILSIEPIRFPLTGIGRYTYELACHLTDNPQIERIRYFSGSKLHKSIPDVSQLNASSGLSMFRAVNRLLSRSSIAVEAGRFLRQSRQRKALAGARSYIYHGPNFYLPPVRGPAAVTFHDLSILNMPEYHPAERVRFMTKEIELSLTRASVIITDSDYVRNEVSNFLSFPLDRIHSVPLAGSAEFFPRDTHQLTPALRRLNIEPGAYTLYAGTIEPRKNLERLLLAYEKLDPRLRRYFPLLLAGYSGWNNEAIMKRIRRAEQEGWARYLGYVPNSLLPSLFAGARLFVFPSIYEGFGLPVLEAMASGVPVVCSNSSSLPEVVGDAAAMCSPFDVNELASLIARGLEDPAWRQQAVDRGIVQSRKFNWHRCASGTVDAYRAALAL